MFFVAPFLIYMGIVFFIPVGLILFTGFVSEDTGEFTFEYFQAFFTQGLYLRVLWTTIEVSFMGALIVLLCGYPIAYYLAKQPPKKTNVSVALRVAAVLHQHSGEELRICRHPRTQRRGELVFCGSSWARNSRSSCSTTGSA